MLAAAVASCIWANAAHAQPQSRAPTMDAQVLELERTFTLSGKPVPPMVFRDLGDGDLADSEHAVDSIDLVAAIGSNLYAATITGTAGWINQRDADGSEAGYRFVGATANGLVAVVSRFSGGGSGMFYVLHILALQSAKTFDAEGHRRDRIDLNTVRSLPLGDRWVGDIRIEGDSLIVRSDRKRGDESTSETRRILAEKP
jgi:hypothetical protein